MMSEILPVDVNGSKEVCGIATLFCQNSEHEMIYS